ncbi:MAG: hypothetical protein ACI89Z_001510 [Porticoccus sp.]
MNAYLSAVNQKLYFSKLLLGQIQSELSCNAQLKEALCQSVLHQLVCAYRHYLREIATTYQFKSPESIFVIEHLSSCLASINKHPGEAQEIANLEANPDSWLYQLMYVYKQSLDLPRPEGKTVESSPIAVMQVDQQVDCISLGYEQLIIWYKNFQEMVDRHRSLMIEC